jgi:prepilin-type N-terminal cleavage/methylation domain-containing protein
MRRGFTLIELLTVIAVIGLLASVLLVATNGVRDDAKDAAVLAQMKSAQVAMTRCMNKGKVMYCRGATLNHSGIIGEINCDDKGDVMGGNIASTPAMNWSLPQPMLEVDSAFCGSATANGDEDDSFGFWPDVTEYGFRYGPRADSDVSRGRFAFYAVEDVRNTTDARMVVCCTQNGCALEEITGADLFDGGANSSWPYGDFCLERAGFDVSGGGAVSGD